MPTVSDICTKNIISIEITATISDAVILMRKENVRSLLVIGSSCKGFFIFTTNDAIEYKINNTAASTQLSNIKLHEVHQVDQKVNILEVINLEEITNEYLIVLSQDKVIGILSQTDIINNIDPQILIQKQSISNIILQYSVQSIYQDEAAINAIKIMRSKDVDAVIIINDKNQPLGIFTTKDFLNIMYNNQNLNLPIKHFMSAPLQTLPSRSKIYEALDFIKKKHFKRIIVTDEHNEISGVITQSELLRLINNKWMELIKDRGNELSKINEKLLKKASILEEKASTDFLTKLFNRRKFDSLTIYEIEQIKRYNRGDLCIIILDIDNFKLVNDTHGHDVGDLVIKEIAKIIKISSRNSDVTCRWGGEEFALSLSQTNIENALIVAQKIRSTIESHAFINDQRITCSFGLSQYRSTDDYHSLFKRADAALYEAKKTGKNKVVIERL